MIDSNNQKRLVLIGIHRKGDKGFQKRFDKREESKNLPPGPVSLPLSPEQLVSKHQIITILPE